MALQVSSGFKDKILGPYAFEDIFDGGMIRVFSGVQPATADDAETGTLLGGITANGGAWAPGTGINGLTFARTDGVVLAPILARWMLSPSMDGTAGWFRLIERAGDGAGVSDLSPRIDGAIGVPGAGLAEMYLDDVVLAAGVQRLITSFFYTIPPVPGL